MRSRLGPTILVTTILFLLVTAAAPPLPAQDAAELRRRAAVLRQAVERCQRRLQSGELTSCSVAARFDINRSLSMDEALQFAGLYERRARDLDTQGERARCQAVRERFIRDREASRRMLADSRMGERELEEWTRRNDEARVAAIQSSLNLLLDGGLAYVAESTRTLNGLKGAYKGMEGRMKRLRGDRKARMQASLDALDQRIRRMDAAVSSAKSLQGKKEKAEVFWGYFSAGAREVDESAGAVGAALAAVEEDPILHKILVDEGLQPLANRMKSWKAFPKRPYVINMAEFLVDYGYSVAEWTLSRNRILEQIRISEERLGVVKTQQENLKRSMTELNACVAKGLVTRPE
ncbi:MAG: hypothetical protein GXY47_15330 [Acidobacteria bacterium]|nr:hypothetical protein [Acidobacteriota bacterium]